MNRYVLFKVWFETGHMGKEFITAVEALNIVDAENTFRDKGYMPVIEGPSYYLILAK